MAAPSHLRSFQAIELAVRSGSLKEAATILGITPAAVGQRIKALEDYLGLELIVRGRSGLRPTAELLSALPHLAKAFQELGEVSELLDFQRVNEIHISANEDFVELWLLPRLTKFRRSYPNILFCVNGEGDIPSRIGKADIEIMFGEHVGDQNNDLLFRDYLCPIGSPENIERIGRLGKKNDLEGFPLLHLDFYKSDPAAIAWPEWIGIYGHRATAFSRGIRYQRIAPGVRAVSSNAGFMVSGLALISERVDRGELQLPFPVKNGAWATHSFYARYRSDAATRNQIKCFRGWLAKEGKKTENWLDHFVYAN